MDALTEILKLIRDFVQQHGVEPNLILIPPERNQEFLEFFPKNDRSGKISKINGINVEFIDGIQTYVCLAMTNTSERVDELLYVVK